MAKQAKMIRCKTCGEEIAQNAKRCPKCGAKNKKPIFRRWWFWTLIALILIIAIAAGGGNGNDETKKVGTVSADTAADTAAAEASEPAKEAQEGEDAEEAPALLDKYHVGDILEDGDMRIVYMASGEYTEENEYLQPQEGNKYIFLEFSFENMSDKDDAYVSSMSFECYADGYNADMYYKENADLDATLSAGRVTTGSVYFEVPEGAQEIEVEYETNFLTEEKITFVYDGDKDAGYAPKAEAKPSEDAFAPGEEVEMKGLTMRYLSCEDYESDNMFIEPKEGFHYVTLTFEVENTGSSDQLISSMEFDCFADGISCESLYVRDDDLSATISAGRKAGGTVTFEVPDAASVIEAEYLTNAWTSDRVVFTVK